MNLKSATQIAIEILDSLAAGCERIEIAGSIRREAREVGDIEIVCIARQSISTDLLGESAPPDSVHLDAAVMGALASGLLEFDPDLKRDGDKYKRLRHCKTQIAVDVFIATQGNWGNTIAIRTGDQHFSRMLMSARHMGGLMPAGLRQLDGYLWRFDSISAASAATSGRLPASARRIECPEERDYFAALGHPVPDPTQRTRAFAEQMIQQSQARAYEATAR